MKAESSQERSVRVRFRASSGETFLFDFLPSQLDETLLTVSKFGADKDIGLTWHEAAFLCGFLRERARHA